jgi:hypothetical protein
MGSLNVGNRRIQIRSDDPIRYWTSDIRCRMNIIPSSGRTYRISDPISDLGRPISGLGRPISDLGRPRSDIGWTSSRLWEELFGSRKIPDSILESDVGPDQIWIHLMHPHHQKSFYRAVLEICLLSGSTFYLMGYIFVKYTTHYGQFEHPHHQKKFLLCGSQDMISNWVRHLPQWIYFCQTSDQFWII